MDRAEALECLRSGSEEFRIRLRRQAIFWTILFLVLAALVYSYVVWIAVFLLFIAVAQTTVWLIVPDDTTRLIQLAEQQTRDVVWVYPMEWSISPFGVYLFRHSYMKIYFADGHVEDIRIPPSETEKWMRCLNVLFPGASFGFTEERSQYFSEDPKSLRQDPDAFNQS